MLAEVLNLRAVRNGEEFKRHSRDAAGRKVTTVDHAPEVAFSLASVLHTL